jgi:hypothetical protein
LARPVLNTRGGLFFAHLFLICPPVWRLNRIAVAETAAAERPNFSLPLTMPSPPKNVRPDDMRPFGDHDQVASPSCNSPPTPTLCVFNVQT